LVFVALTGKSPPGRTRWSTTKPRVKIGKGDILGRQRDQRMLGIVARPGGAHGILLNWKALNTDQ
jgi:hypothetical protein